MSLADIPRRQPPTLDGPLEILDSADPLGELTTLFARHGDIYRVYDASQARYTYVVHDPGDVRHVLATHQRNYTKGAGIDRVRVLLGESSMTAEGDVWRRHRGAVQPLLH